MRKSLLILAVAMMCTLTFGAGIAFALPTTLTDSNNQNTNTWTGSGAGNNPIFRYNTDAAATANAGAEHSYTNRPANLSYGPHGKFTTDTNACGRCHQLHQAEGERLFRFNIANNVSGNNSIYKICTFCHNFNGQSTYDVKDGMIWDTSDGYRYATNGGGFERMLVVEGPPNAATLVKANSSHQVNLANTAGGAYIRLSAPGTETTTDTPNTGKHIQLKCSSCHNPHGSSNARILAETVTYTNSAGGGVATTASLTGIPEFVQNRFANEKAIYPTTISDFCGRCHQDYINTIKTGSETSGTNISTLYRHKINMSADSGFNKLSTEAASGADAEIGAAMSDGSGRTNDGSFGYIANRIQLPLGTANATPITAPVGEINKVVCTSCHFAHGTSAEMTKAVMNNSAGSNPRIDSNGDVAGNQYSLLTVSGGIAYETIKNLRMDNRAVCQNCHNRNSTDITAPDLIEPLDPTQLNTSTVYSAATKITAGQMVKRYTVGTVTVTVLRFNQYMAKAAVETVTNYTFSGGTGGANPTTATLQPDGKTVILQGGSTDATTLTLTAGNLMNVNGLAAVITGGNAKAIN